MYAQISGKVQLSATPLRKFLNLDSSVYPGTLLAELREYNLEQQRRAHCEALSPDGLPEEQPQTTKLKGKMQSRWVVTHFGCGLESGTFKK